MPTYDKQTNKQTNIVYKRQSERLCGGGLQCLKESIEASKIRLLQIARKQASYGKDPLIYRLRHSGQDIIVAENKTMKNLYGK